MFKHQTAFASVQSVWNIRIVNEVEVFIPLSQWDLEISFIIHLPCSVSYSNLRITDLARYEN